MFISLSIRLVGSHFAGGLTPTFRLSSPRMVAFESSKPSDMIQVKETANAN